MGIDQCKNKVLRRITMGNDQNENLFKLISAEKKDYEKEIVMEFEDKEKKAFEEANEIFFHLKDWEKTAKFFEEKALYLNAGIIYKKAGDKEKSKINFEKVAQIFEKKGLYLKAAYIYEKIGDIGKAAITLGKWYFYNKEASHYNQDLSNINGYLMKAVELYLRINRINEAYQLSMKGEKYQMAVEILLKDGKLLEAAELSEKIQLPLKAAEIYEKLGKSKKAFILRAEEALRFNNLVEAAEWYLKAEDFVMASELFERVDEYKKAAEIYYMSKNYSKAARNYLKISCDKDAVEMFELGGELRNAADILFELDEYKKAGDYYEKCGDHYKAGYSFLKAKDDERALFNFQKVKKSSSNYFDSIRQITNFFLKEKKPELVIYNLEKLLNEKTFIESDIDLYYNLGRAYEDLGSFEKASGIYKEILEKDYFFRDVQQKLEEVEGLIERYKLMKMERSDATKRYKILSEVGGGGMGIVFRAEDLYLQRIVAIKVMNEKFAKDEIGLERFYTEARAVALLSHPNIVKVYDVGRMNKDHFISMEYIEGENLNTLMKSHKVFPIEQVVIITKKISKALFYAHEKGIIHRDIKPHNIMITKDHELKIMDFGIASIKGKYNINEGESLSGTPYYMSPEQIQRKKTDHRTDIYSTGVTLFHIITGDVPFKGKSIFFQHINYPVPSIKKIRPETPDILVEIVEKCMEKEPDDRYESAKDIIYCIKKIKMIPKKIDNLDIQDSEIPTEVLDDIDNALNIEDEPTEAINDIDDVTGNDNEPTVVSNDIDNVTRIGDESTFNRDEKTTKRRKKRN